MSKECTNSRIAQHRKELKTEIVRMDLGLPQCNTSQICISYLLLIVKEKQKKTKKRKEASERNGSYKDRTSLFRGLGL